MYFDPTQQQFYPDEPKVILLDWDEQPLYEGDDYYIIHGDLVHEDDLVRYIKENYHRHTVSALDD